MPASHPAKRGTRKSAMPCRFIEPPLTRRAMLARCANGFGAVALAGLLADEVCAAGGPWRAVPNAWVGDEYRPEFHMQVARVVARPEFMTRSPGVAEKSPTPCAQPMPGPSSSAPDGAGGQFVQKPLTPDVLLAKVRRALDEERAAPVAM